MIFGWPGMHSSSVSRTYTQGECPLQQNLWIRHASECLMALRTRKVLSVKIDTNRLYYSNVNGTGKQVAGMYLIHLARYLECASGGPFISPSLGGLM